MNRIKILLVLCIIESVGFYGVPRVAIAESEEHAILRENREAMQSTWKGSVTLEENSCYYRTWPEKKIAFKTKGELIGKTFKLTGFQRDSFIMQEIEDFQFPTISFIRWKRDRYGRLTNCYRYEWLTFESFNSTNEAEVSFQREYHCGGLYFCSTVFKGTARRQGKIDIEGLYRGEMYADPTDDCNNEDMPNFWHSVSKATNGSLQYADPFLPTNSHVPLRYNSASRGLTARYSFTWNSPTEGLCKIDAVYEGTLESPGRYLPLLEHTYNCESWSYTCRWDGFGLVRRR